MRIVALKTLILFLIFFESNAFSSNFALTAAKKVGIESRLISTEPIRIQFQPLNYEQFKRLKSIYGNNQSQVTFESGKQYELRDFLPPVMQALLSRSPKPFSEPLPNLVEYQVGVQELGEETQALSEVDYDQNCWGTSYEVFRHLQNPNLETYTFFMTDQTEMKKALYSHMNSVRENKASFGDILLIQQGGKLYSSNDFLAHTAIRIDNDLLFEKTGPGQSWRLVFKKELEERFRDQDLVTHMNYLHANSDLADPKIFSIQGLETTMYKAKVVGTLRRIFSLEAQSKIIYAVDNGNPHMGRSTAGFYGIQEKRLGINALGLGELEP